MTNAILLGKPYAGKPHVAPMPCFGGRGQFDAGKAASYPSTVGCLEEDTTRGAKHRYGSLFRKLILTISVSAVACTMSAQDHNYTAPATVSDSLVFQSGDRVFLSGEGEVKFTGNMSVSGGACVPFVVNSTKVTYTLGNDLSGTGTLDFLGTGEVADESSCDKQVSSTEIVVAAGRSLETLVGISGTEMYQGDTCLEELSGSGDDYKSKVFFFENNGAEATCQVQIRQTYNKCAMLQFSNKNGDLVCKVTASIAQDLSKAPVDGTYDYRVEGHKYTGNYNVRKMTLHFLEHANATLSCTGNTMVDSVFNVTNGLRMSVGNVTSLPATGEVHVWSNSVLTLTAGSATGQNGGNVAVYAHPGAVVAASGKHSIGRDIEKGVTLDGAELVFTDDPGYCNILTLMNGSRVRTDDPAKGIWCVYNWEKALWTADGTSPSYIDSRVRVAISSLGYRFKLDVKNVTGDAEPDLFLRGSIGDYDTTTHHFGVVEKRGSGTARHDAVNTVEHGVAILAGEWLLGTNLAMNATQPLELAGGTLGVAANCSNGVGIVTLKADSGIRLEEGSVLTFADQSSATGWTKGKTIMITGAFHPGMIRFGTSAEALTPTQRRAFRFEGHSLGIDANGYLVEPPGLVLIVR